MADPVVTIASQTVKSTAAVEPKGLSQLGEANIQDVSKFQNSLGTGNPALQPGAPSSIEAGGPFSVQSMRITDAKDVASPQSSLVGESKNLLTVGRDQEAAIKTKLEEAVSKGETMSPALAAQLQYEVGSLTIFTDIVSKGVSKVTQSIQTAAKNQ